MKSVRAILMVFFIAVLSVGIGYIGAMITDPYNRHIPGDTDSIWISYTVRVGNDTAYIFHEDRYVGAIPYSDTDALSQLIREDNR